MVEVQLERYPWATLSDDKGGRRELACPTTDGEWRAYTVEGDRLPGPFDADVYVGLCHLLNAERDRAAKPGRVSVSYKGLCDIMRRTRGGTVYRAIDEALWRLANVHIEAIRTWSEGPDKMDQVNFPILTATHVKTARLGLAGYDMKQLTIDFNPHILAALTHKYRLLDIDRYFALTLPTARRLYRYLDYRRHLGPVARHRFELTYIELAFEIPLPRAWPSQVRATLQPALDELQTAGFLEGALWGDKALTLSFAPERRPEPRLDGRLDARLEPRVARGLPGSAAEARELLLDADEQFALAPLVQQAPPRRRPGKEAALAEWVVEEVCRVLQDGPRSQAFYQKAVQDLGAPLIEILLGRVREIARTDPDRARKFFTAAVKGRLAAKGVASNPVRV